MAEEGLDALRVAYQTLRDQYERRTTKSDLARQADAESRRAALVGARLHPFGAVVARARELLATPGAQSAGFRAERLVRARHELEEATAARIRAEEERKRAENELTRLTREARNLTTLPDELRPVDRACRSSGGSTRGTRRCPRGSTSFAKARRRPPCPGRSISGGTSWPGRRSCPSGPPSWSA